MVITRQHGGSVVVVAQSDWKALEEALYLLSSPANAKPVMDGIAELDVDPVEEHALIYP